VAGPTGGHSSAGQVRLAIVDSNALPLAYTICPSFVRMENVRRLGQI
jgi:hypothetical protein